MTGSPAVTIRLLSAGALGALMLAGLARTAAAETAAEAATRWRLPGTWKLDCAKPTSRANVAFTFAVREGKLYLDRDLGDAQDSNLIPDATITLDGDLETTTAFGAATPRTVVQRKKGEDRFTVWSNRATFVDDYSIKDGRLTNGADAPVLTRCRQP